MQPTNFEFVTNVKTTEALANPTVRDLLTKVLLVRFQSPSSLHSRFERHLPTPDWRDEGHLPKAKSIAPEEVRAAALSMDLPSGSLINGSGLKFSNFDLPNDPKDAGQNIRSSIGVWQWQNKAARQVYPKNLATNEIAMVPLPDWSKR